LVVELLILHYFAGALFLLSGSTLAYIFYAITSSISEPLFRPYFPH